MNLWILTEERPSYEDIKEILNLYCKKKNLVLKIQALKIKPTDAVPEKISQNNLCCLSCLE